MVNVGTSAQLGFLLELPATEAARDSLLDEFLRQPGVSIFPFHCSSEAMHVLALAASLNGGNVLTAFVRAFSRWCAELTGVEQQMDEATVWSRLEQLYADRSHSKPASVQSPLPLVTIDPLLNGERHDPARAASASGLTGAALEQLALSDLYRSTCDGLTRNLSRMMPPPLLRRAGVRRLLGTGSALARNSALRDALVSTFGPQLDSVQVSVTACWLCDAVM